MPPGGWALPEDALAAQLAGHLSIGAANAAYEQWLRDESSDLTELVHRAFGLIESLPEMVTPKSRRRPRRPIIAS